MGLDVTLDLGAQGAAGHGEGHPDLHRASFVDVDGGDHAQFDDVGAQLGIDHTPEGGRTFSSVGTGGPRPRRRTRKCRAWSPRNSTGRAGTATRSDVPPVTRRGYACSRFVIQEEQR